MDQDRPRLNPPSPFRSLLNLVMACLLSGMAFSALGMSLLPRITGLGMDDLTRGLEGYGQQARWEEWLRALNLQGWELSAGLMGLQGLTTLGFFVLPGLWFLQNRLDGRKDDESHPLHWRGLVGPGLLQALLSVAVLLALLPLIYTVYHWNHALRLLADSVPLVAQWVATEEQASLVIALLLDQNGTAFVIASLVVLVILPAVGEEIIFRGSLQPLLARVLRRPHAAIWVSALIFSAIHGQWLGFVPRCLLGALFGYLALWTGSLWPSVLAHLSNNLLSLWAYRWNWLNARAVIEESDAAYRWSDAPVAWWVLLPATLIGVFLLIQLVRRSNS